MKPVIKVAEVTKTFKRPLDRGTTLKYRMTHPRSSSRFERFVALEDVSFEVPEGQFLGIIGPNGCGKSTLLKILSRIYQPDRGRVSVEGRVSPFLELGVGFNPELSARENVFLNGAVLGLTRSDLQLIVDEVIAFAELTEFADMKLKNFSSGMQVRLAFSVAIRAEAEILLMDEVLAVGDARFVEKCFDVFARHKREGHTIVLVTHDLGSVNLYCDRAILLDHGRILADGEPRAVTAKYMRMVGAISDSDPASDTLGQAHRWGSGEVTITDMAFLDAEGAPHHTFITGEPMVIEIGYSVSQDVGAFTCMIGIERSDGLGLTASNLAAEGRPLACPEPGGGGRVRYEIPSMGLLQATYLLTAAVTDVTTMHVYDRIERGASFHVVDDKGRMGLIDLGGRWVSRSAPAPMPASPTPHAAGVGRGSSRLPPHGESGGPGTLGRR